MRTYYIFKINDSFSNLYSNKTYYLFKMLDQIYNSNKNDFAISCRLFEQIIEPINRTKINSKIYKRYEYDPYYYKTLNKHLLDNNIEKTRLTTYNTYMKIKSNKNITEFLNVISVEENLFVCDFGNKDYFWLDKVLTKRLV